MPKGHLGGPLEFFHARVVEKKIPITFVFKPPRVFLPLFRRPGRQHDRSLLAHRRSKMEAALRGTPRSVAAGRGAA